MDAVELERLLVRVLNAQSQREARFHALAGNRIEAHDHHADGFAEAETGAARRQGNGGEGCTCCEEASSGEGHVQVSFWM
ncbi:hypothetical protein GCM10023089_08640 [Quisquiliibacterium transsilvanicum]